MYADDKTPVTDPMGNPFEFKVLKKKIRAGKYMSIVGNRPLALKHKPSGNIIGEVVLE